MNIAFLIPLPFLLALIYALAAKKNKAIGYVGAAAGLITFVFVLLAWNSQGTDSFIWFDAGTVIFSWTVMTDNLSLLLSAIISGIGALIFLYSVGYLEPDEDLKRYYAEMALFAASMLGVVTSANLFQTFFCWELVGVSSYLLIGFWHEKESAIAAARKAFITIIIGDAFFLAAILLLFREYGTFSIPILLSAARANSVTVIAGFCIIVGAISKSAQFPLHTWLPDAMEGPTPVSAFLHSAAMVKAGLFIVARFLPLLLLVGLSPVIIIIAVITIIISACMALVENDVKRVLAYSTMNQLAFILLTLGLGATAAGLYHLLNHSVFKALLFMVAGAIIHLAGTQDITKMNLKLGWNLLAVTTAIGAIALAGLPPFSGFFSKDAIFEAVLASHSVALIAVFSLAIILSAAYIFRWYFLIFRKDGFVSGFHWEMKLPLPVLATLAALGGLATAGFFTWWHEPTPAIGLASLVSTLLALAGFACAYLIYYKHAWNIERLARSPLAAVFRARFLLDDVYDALAKAVFELGAVCFWLDEHVINRLLEGTARFFSGLGAVFRRTITGKAPSYLTAFVIGFIILVLAVRFA